MIDNRRMDFSPCGRLATFGSVARAGIAEGSDIDILVVSEGKPIIDAFMDLKFYLQGLPERPVGLVAHQTQRPKQGSAIEGEVIRIT